MIDDLALPTLRQQWRKDAACAGDPRPLWDDKVHGETPLERGYRHEAAKRICAGCPVAFECGRDVDWVWDEGIRAGQLLPEKKNAARPKGRVA